MCRAVLSALAYLHGLSPPIIHRDVKGRNILVGSQGVAKLTDFGGARVMEGGSTVIEYAEGTPYWMAPEVIAKCPLLNGASDVWSLGVTAIELAEGGPPRSELKTDDLFQAIVSDPPPALTDGTKPPRRWSAKFHDFVSCCLVKVTPSIPQCIGPHDARAKGSNGAPLCFAAAEPSVHCRRSWTEYHEHYGG